MRWPLISRDLHEQMLARLEQQLAEANMERRKTQDELIRVLGGNPYNFPQTQNADAEVAEPANSTENEADWLEYLRRNRPSEFPRELARIRLRGPVFTPKSEERVKSAGNVASAFDQAEQEVRQKTA